MPNVFPHDFGTHLIAHRSGEIAIFPKLSAPQLPFDLGEFSEDRSATETFQPPNHLRYGVARRKRTQNMDVFDIDFHLVDFDVIWLGDFLK